MEADRLIERIEALERDLARLRDEAQIRSVIDRYGRAVDRLDAGLLASLFHDDADIHYGADVFEGDALAYVPAILKMAASMVRSQHMMGHSMIELDGDRAHVETYGQAMQMLDGGNGVIEFGTGCRYLDRFERRGDGVWRIAHRQVVVDWLRELKADETLFGRFRGPPPCGHAEADPSASFFPGSQ
jgi:hypothetical protein